MNDSRIWWYWTSDAGARFECITRFGAIFGALLVLVLVGSRFVAARPYVCALVYLLLPIAGVLSPMVRHFGDRSWEMYRYTEQRYAWKAGEFLGTWPFYVLGKHVRAIHDIRDRQLAIDLAVVGALGALGFFLLAVHIARLPESPAQPRKPGVFRFTRDLLRTDAGYLQVIAFALLPCFLVYAGFIQTTFVSDLLLPWVLLLLVRAFSRPSAVTWDRMLALRAGEIVVAWLATAALYLSHGAAVVLLLGALSAAVIRLGQLAWVALRRLRVPAARWVLDAWLLATGVLTALCLGPFTGAMTRAYPTVFRDSWVPASGTLKDRLLALRAITHAIPRWVPVFGEPHPTCGQQTWLLSPGWVKFTTFTLAHVTVLVPWVAFVGWRRFERARGAPQTTGHEVPAPLLASSLFAVLFLALYSPHFSQPQDMDVILVPASIVSVCAISAIGASSGRDARGAPAARWMAAVALYEGFLLCASWAMQSATANVPMLRGISQPWC